MVKIGQLLLEILNCGQGNVAGVFLVSFHPNLGAGHGIDFRLRPEEAQICFRAAKIRQNRITIINSRNFIDAPQPGRMAVIQLMRLCHELQDLLLFKTVLGISDPYGGYDTTHKIIYIVDIIAPAVKIPMRLLTRSTLLHLRFPFSLLLLPVFIFALSQSRVVDPIKALLVFFSWHFFIYPASNGYNSYFDKDTGSIALIKKPPPVDKGLYHTSLLFELAGLLLALLVNREFCFSVFLYGLLSKMYSHPRIRLKKHPLWSFLVVFLFQGAFIYWSSYAAVSGVGMYTHWSLNADFRVAGLICSFLIGASYPLTQVYQHEEDAKRGDRTLSLVLGTMGSFRFSALMFILGTLSMYRYWQDLGQPENFYLFLACMLPVAGFFVLWYLRVWRDRNQASFQNMSRMTFLSGGMMLIYFTIIWIRG